MDYLWIGLGGLVGCNLRFIVGRAVADRLGSAFPYGTFLVNCTGSLLIGVIATLIAERFSVPASVRPLVIIGFLGGYTTFSSYTLEALALIEQGAWGRALVYVVGSNVLGLLACYAGMVLARSFGS
ncbi:MAG TPA: fluoride efflux transporter CrcB [Thermomicrobiales bacterium]